MILPKVERKNGHGFKGFISGEKAEKLSVLLKGGQTIIRVDGGAFIRTRDTDSNKNHIWIEVFPNELPEIRKGLKLRDGYGGKFTLGPIIEAQA
jgi:hypothetical protein